MSPGLVVHGVVPPPHTGAAIVTQRAISVLSETHRVFRLVVSCGRLSDRGTLWRCLRLGMQLVCLLALPLLRFAGYRRLYVAANARRGLVLTVAVCYVAEKLGFVVVVHHHVFGYLSVRRRTLLWLVRHTRVRHLVLCAKMAALLQERYGATDVRVVSNAWVIDRQKVQRRPSGVVRFGHLSNLCESKGAAVVMDIVRALCDTDVDFEFVVAGPTVDATGDRLVASLRAIDDRNVRYVGPKYGDEKRAFFEEIDVFVFPTLYADEADPLVLHEAVMHGCEIMSLARGCIAENFSHSGVVVESVPELAALVVARAREGWKPREQAIGEMPRRLDANLWA